MAAECTETSVVNPNPNSSAQNWWHEIMHANSLCSWTTPGNGAGAGDGDGVSLVAASSNNNFPWQHSSNNHSSESSGEDDVSISNQSVLTAESSRQLVDGGGAALAGDLIGETTSDQNHLWSHFLLSGGSTRGGMEYKSHHPQQVVGEGMLNLSSSSSTNLDIMSNCDDYLKKMGTYEFNLSTAALKDPGGFINHPFGGGGHETQRPPAGMLDHHHHHQPPPPMFAGGHPCGQLHDVSCICSNTNHHNNNNNPSRELNDFSASFQSYLSKPLLDMNHEYKPTLKTLQYLSSSSPAGYITKKNAAAGLRPSPVQSRASTCSALTRSHGRGQGIVGNEGRKKKTEDNTEKMNLKRPKNDNNPASKMQVPKVKLADKITALQQIVSPFGKTDTASVLWEAIGHIRFLQEQIQLLTNAYAKSNARKDVPWGGLLVDGRKDVGGDAKVVDLRSRGLCLVPISYTPQIYRESNASDYLIPTYRGCLYG